jgi:hypothetical protein
MTDRCVSCGDRPARHASLCTDCTAHGAWESLPPEVQAEIDQLVRECRGPSAIYPFIDHGNPRPNLRVFAALLDTRRQALGLMPGSPSE